MQERTYTRDIQKKTGEKVVVKGFVQAIRDQGSIKFLIIRDVTGVAQVVVVKSVPEVFETVSGLSIESVVEIAGEVKTEPQAPGGFEVKAEKLTVLSVAAAQLPIPVVVEKGAEDVDITKRFDWRWLDLRREETQRIFKAWTAFEKGARMFFSEQGFIQLYTPSFMTAPSESGAELFEVQYFDRKAYLAQSPQFFKQLAMAAGMEKVFMVGPVFRAEPSFTTRHMTEFTGLDFEISYIESHHDVMDVEEQMIVAAFTQLKKELIPELEVPMTPFPRIPLAEAKEKLAQAGIKSEKDYDVSPEEERELCKIVKKETGHDFVFLTDWQTKGRSFYHMRHEDDDKLTKGFDLLYKGLEVTTGAQREHRPELLEKQAKEMGMDLNPLQGYFDFFRYGCPPHGGVGNGLGRFIMQILDLASVKEAAFLPRDVKRLKP